MSNKTYCNAVLHYYRLVPMWAQNPVFLTDSGQNRGKILVVSPDRSLVYNTIIARFEGFVKGILWTIDKTCKRWYNINEYKAFRERGAR